MFSSSSTTIKSAASTSAARRATSSTAQPRIRRGAASPHDAESGYARASRQLTNDLQKAACDSESVTVDGVRTACRCS